MLNNNNKSFKTEIRDIKDSYLDAVIRKGLDSNIVPHSLFKTELQEIEDKYYQEVRNERLYRLSKPTSVNKKYKRPSSPKHIVAESALKYKATDRIIAISKPKRYNSAPKGGITPGSVSHQALDHLTTNKEYELSIPRSRKSPFSVDFKQNPFSPSKAAMRYIASPRIIELAKPNDRR
ncbi:uncharacterized protein [Onthophagus taurus]